MPNEILSRTSLSKHRGGLTDYVSASRLSLWLRCPLAFKFRYVDGIRTPPSANLFLGKRVHDGLEYYYRHAQAGVRLSGPEVARHITRHWEGAADAEQIVWEKADDSQALRTKCQDLVACYLDRFVDAGEQILGVESAMEATLLDPVTGERLALPMVGIVDLLVETNDGPILVDFKTVGRGGTPVAQQHEIQLGCYSLLFRELTGTLESGLEIRSLVKTKRPKVEVHRFEPRSARHVARLFTVIREYLKAIERGVFNFRPGMACLFCDVRETHCPTWSGHRSPIQKEENGIWANC